MFRGSVKDYQDRVAFGSQFLEGRARRHCRKALECAFRVQPGERRRMQSNGRRQLLLECEPIAAALDAGKRAADGAATVDSARWRLTAGPALLAAWCLIYVIEIVRHAAAVYGL